MKLPLAVAAAMILLCGSAHAIPIVYTFIQNGYAEGAYVSGSFIVDDKNGNGISGISIPDAELSVIGARFSGNSIIPAFGVGAPRQFLFNKNTLSLSFSADDTPASGINFLISGGPSGGSLLYDNGPGDGKTLTTSQGIVVTDPNGVPDAGGTASMLAATMGLLSYARRTRWKSQSEQ